MKLLSKPNLAILGGNKVIGINQGAHFNWPKITDEIEELVIDQLHASISIYDRSSIFEAFECEFARLHNRKYALLTNSGTSAIHSMFDALNISPGDEVVCPVYTFHATISPLISLGGVPIFADVDPYGSMSLEDLVKKVGPRTRAVIVTHMWGYPCRDIEKIALFCKERDLYLLEDCSHAHGARTNTGRIVGSFGDAAAWSLQGQKTITGGEGGIVLSDRRSIYNQALLLGHYNKRPKQEIDVSDPLYKFYLTGKGQKLRAHPLAIKIAYHQLGILPTILQGRDSNAQRFRQLISEIEFLSDIMQDGSSPSWYAFGMLFDESKSNGVTRFEFCEMLHHEGLSEVDIPGSTGLLNELPLFTEPNELFPTLFGGKLPRQRDFKNALSFKDRFIKMPVWAFTDEAEIVEKYLIGFEKVCRAILEDRNFGQNLRNWRKET
ncbi:DegT/DnrJ/EryC1/StrS family aminotransferase [Pseudovibrio ascidiaceicola]|uniref:DegT/DnrJ/EryC1/StrS family aminotransferase n=1 Tax=Pseudovibrio ascidiaceicola TaxID=285279 RepID=UPI003D3643B4